MSKSIIAGIVCIALYATLATAEKCVWTIGGVSVDGVEGIQDIRDNGSWAWQPNTNDGGGASMAIGWANCWAESLCNATACGSLVCGMDELGNPVYCPAYCPYKLIWDALPDDECGPCPDAGGGCPSQEYVHRTTQYLSMVWFDLTGLPEFVSLDSAICSLYVASQIGLGYAFHPTCNEWSYGRLDVIADTISQDWVEGDGSTPYNVGAPCFQWANRTVRGIPRPDSSETRYHSVGGTAWDCGDNAWDIGPSLRSPMDWLGQGVDTVTFDTSNVGDIPGYFGWRATDIVQDMYDQQVSGTSNTGFGIAFYDTTFWADGTICESANTSISIVTRDAGAEASGTLPKLVLWYECGEGEAPVDTAQRPQLIYIND